MFKFNIRSWPWEDGIKPDAQNENGCLWVEEHFTHKLRTDRNGKKIKELKDSIVALWRYSDGVVVWVFMNEKDEVFEQTTSIEELGVLIGKWHLIYKECI